MKPPVGIDDQRFFATLAGEDPLGVIVRGLAYIESEVVALCEEAAAHPSAIKDMSLDYSGRVSLAVVLGLRPSLQKPLAAVGRLRNKFAHDIDAKVGPSEAKNLLATFAAEDRKVVEDTYNRLAKVAGRSTRLSGLDAVDQVRIAIVTLRQAIRAARTAVAQRSPPSA